MKNKIFVYGTLMSGMKNNYMLENANFLGSDEIHGYIMYDLGAYPGIKKGKSYIKGEVYELNDEHLEKIDFFEGLGFLYEKEIVETKYGSAYIYVYMNEINDMPIIPYDMQPYNNLIYYVSYGSNMLEERLLNYIEGTSCKYNDKLYSGCSIKNKPIKSKSVIIPYNMYYSKESSNWFNSSVCFLDTSKSGKAYGRAYLISKKQFDEILIQEGKSWYGNIIKLDNIDGFKTCTFTSNYLLEKKGFESVGKEYRRVLIDGLKESFPNLSDKEIDKYLENCGKL